MLIEELRVKISAEMQSLQSAFSDIKSKLSNLQGKAQQAENSFNKIGKSGAQSFNEATQSINTLKKSIVNLLSGKGSLTEAKQLFTTLSASIKRMKASGDMFGKGASINPAVLTGALQDVDKYINQTKKKLEEAKNLAQDFFDMGDNELSDTFNGLASALTNNLPALEEMRKIIVSLMSGEKNEKGNFLVNKSTLDGFRKLTEQLDNYGEKLGDVSDIQSVFGNSAVETADAIGDMSISGAQLGRLVGQESQAIGMTEGLSSSFAVLIKQLAGVALALGAVVGLMALYVNRIKREIKAFKSLADLFTQGAYALGKFTKEALALSNRLNPFPTIVKSITKSVETLLSKIKTAFIYTAVNEAFKEVRETITKYLSINDTLTSALGRLRASWLTAFQPIYEAVVPMLITLCNYLTMAGQAVASFIAMITGGKVSVFRANAKALYEQANAMDEIKEGAEGASESAKEAQKTLAGFDELELLQKRSEAGGGGGSDAETALDGLEWIDVEKKLPHFDTWGEAFSALLDKILGKLPKLADWLTIASDKINTFFSNLKEMFTYQGNLEKVSQIANNLANTFNNFLNQIDWKTMGDAVGAGLNTVLQFVVDFIDTFDFQGLGFHIADLFNGMFSYIDWENVGKALTEPWNMVWETLKGFVINLDWSSLGTDIGTAINTAVKNINLEATAIALSEGIKGIFTSAIEAVKLIDVSEITKKIDDFFNNLDVKQIINKAQEFVQQLLPKLATIASKLAVDVLKMINDAVKSVDWKSLGTTLGQMINSLDLETIFTELATLVNSKLPHLLELIAGALRELDWVKVGNAVANSTYQALVSIDWASILTSLVEILYEAVKGLITVLMGKTFGFLGSLVPQLAQVIVGLFESVIVLLSDVIIDLWNEMGKNCSLGWVQGVSEWLEKTQEKIITLFRKVVDAIRNFFGIHSPSTMFADIGNDLIAGLIQGLEGKWKDITSWFKTNFTTIVENIKGWWKDIKTDTEQKWQSIKDTVGSRIDELKSNAEQKFEGLKGTLTSTVMTLKTTVIQRWTEIKTNVSNLVGQLRTSVESTFDTLKTNVSTKAGKIGSALQEKFTEAKNTITGIMNTLATSVGDILDGIKTAIDGAWGHVKDFVSDIGDRISRAWEDIRDFASNAGSAVDEAVSEAVSSAGSAIKEAVSGVVETVSDGIQKGVEQIAKNPPVVVVEPKKTTTKKTTTTTPYQGITDPRYMNEYATGGIITSPTVALVGEYPNASHNPEIITPQNLLTEIVSSNNSDLINVWLQTTRQIISAIENKDLDVRIDDDAIAGSVIRSNLSAIRRTGQPLLA